jgi:hypothetical protein
MQIHHQAFLTADVQNIYHYKTHPTMLKNKCAMRYSATAVYGKICVFYGYPGLLSQVTYIHKCTS